MWISCCARRRLRRARASQPAVPHGEAEPRIQSGGPARHWHRRECGLAHIFQRLRSAHGVDFTHYKRTTIRRRLERRMMLRRIESLDEYRESLERDPGELAALYQDFLIRVTEFFRDPTAFDVLRQDVLPTLCEGRSPNERSASGCPAARPARRSIPSPSRFSNTSVTACR